MKFEKLNIHIVGGTGQMGSWLKKFLESQGVLPTISDKKIKKDNLIKFADIIFISVPINVTEEVILETGKKIKKDTLLIDLSSIKTKSTEALKKTALPSIGLHFLFGPTLSSIQNQRVAYTPVKVDGKSKLLIKLLKAAGAQIIEMTAREHDYQMAHIQALTHFVNFSLAKVLLDDKIKLSGQISTPVFLAQMSATSRIIYQNPDLIAQIQTLNPNFLEIVRRLQKDQSVLIELIEKKEVAKLEELYQQISGSLESSGPINRQTKQNLHDLEKLKLKEKISISYLGPEGTFSHQAATQIVTDKAALLPAKTIYDIFNRVAQGLSDFGIVPAENSIEGTVRETLDFLVDFDLRVNLEMALPVHQNLLSKQSDLEKIKKVISHPQAIAQSREWLEKNLPDASIEFSTSTIAAIDELDNKNSAIIGSALAAKIYSLQILAKNIESKEINITKFYLISKNPISLKKKPTKTLLFLTVFNRVGILKDILTVFADFDINLNKLESRPSKEKNWDYYFYVEVESVVNEQRLIQALNILKQFCPVIKSLGDY